MPRDQGRVSMYVCGPTVYDVPHIGHGRFALVFDVLRRYLEFSGYEVDHVSNITDIDDKIIRRSNDEACSASAIASRYETVWWDAMDALGVLRPTAVPHATEFVEQMVGMIEELVQAGVAYETSDGVYLAVDKVPGYGLLAHQSLDSLRSGARVEPGEEKRSQLDFVLWKKAKPGEPTWPSPWGEGRPGWHTECVVMSLGLLGEGFDIHGGAVDLVFPHHENERAQAVALGRSFATHWVHNGWVMMGGEKMSKSLGNFTSLTDMLERTDARAYRLLVLRSHYRSPIEVTPQTVADAEEGLARLDALARRFALGSHPDPSVPAVRAGAVEAGAVEAGAVEAGAVETGIDAGAVERFRVRMDDDLDTPGALAEIFDLLRQANSAADAGDEETGYRLARTVAALCAALGLDLHGDQEMADDRAQALVAKRDAARAARRFDEADELRRELEVLGWIVEDTPGGTRLHRRSGSG